jgi:predicted metal-dependent phosphoesterase TrpH
VVATNTGATLTTTRRVASDEHWYFLRVRRAGQPVAYSSPIWVNSPIPPAGPGPDAPTLDRDGWLAGDLHVHTCYSHDAWCAGIDPDSEREPGLDGETVDERFTEAAQRGLDYLAITDHNDVRSVTDAGFGTHGVIGVPGYENSLHGHAQMLGTRTVLDKGDSSAAAVNRMAAELRAGGGVFQANHPGDDVEVPFVGCDATPLDWGYAFDVRPDTIELLNPTSPAQVAEQYLECWLQRGVHVGVTGGSDSHLRLLSAAGVGFPTTWVLPAERSERGVLDAIRAGRTTVSGQPPTAGGAPLLIEAKRNGTWEQAIGDTVQPGTPLRARSLDPLAGGFLRVRANGLTLLDQELAPGGSIAFAAPLVPGWVRAVLRSEPGTIEQTICGPPWQAIVLCPYDRGMVGMTSPVYVAP